MKQNKLFFFADDVTTITTVFQCVLKKAICYNMFYEILSGTKTIFSEGKEDGHLERRETL